MEIRTRFSLGDEVFIDAEKSIRATIITLSISDNQAPQYEVSWFSNGQIYSAWCREWRLSDVR